MTKLLIIGAGLLGSSLAHIAREDMQTSFTYNFHPAEIEGCRSYRCDIFGCLELILSLRPDYVVLTAALTDVDQCESDRKAAWQVNAVGPKSVASACHQASSKLIYVSTDYVFDGKKGNYSESDATSPVNYYAESKLAGEHYVQEACPDSLILRPSVLYGWNPTRLNFATWIISELSQGRMINVLTDQYNSPTYASDLAGIILRLKDETGLFHASGRERINRYSFALKIAETFDQDSSLIRSVTSDALSWKARRPQDSSLNVYKLSRIVLPMNVSEGLKDMVSEKKTR